MDMDRNRLRDGDDLIVIASNVAETASGARRERLWAMLRQRYPFFADHEAKSTREIPVVALARM